LIFNKSTEVTQNALILWNSGKMEYWNVRFCSFFQYSSTPLFPICFEKRALA